MLRCQVLDIVIYIFYYNPKAFSYYLFYEKNIINNIPTPDGDENKQFSLIERTVSRFARCQVLDIVNYFVSEANCERSEPSEARRRRRSCKISKYEILFIL